MHKSTLALYSVLIALLVGCVAGEVGEKKVLPGAVALSLNSISPAGGNPAGGTSVTLSGTGFENPMTVLIGGSTCTVTSSTSNSITCTTPAHAIGVVDVFVFKSNGDYESLTSAFTYRNAPTLAVITPSFGSNLGSNGIALTGSGYLSGASVTVGTLACSGVTVVGPTSITCTIPSCGGSCPYTNATVNVSVANTDGQVSGTQTYTFADTPVITSVTPNAGALGGAGTVVIAGSKFKPIGITDPTVDIGGSACTVTSATDTSITCTTTAGTAGTKTVTVTNESGLSGSLLSGFTYRAAPTITSLSIPAGNPAGGYTTTITGTNFDVTNGAVINVGGTACTTSSVVSTTSATCQVPAGALGATTLTFVNNDANSQAVAAPPTFTYQNAPTLTAVYDKVLCDADTLTPTTCTTQISAGPLSGLRQVYVVGTGLVTGATVAINGSACSSVAVDASNNFLTCVTPANAAGTYDIIVTNADGQNVTLSSAYTYRASPTISSFTPNAGALAGSTTVIISGTGFLAGASVVFDNGGTPATCTVASITSSQIICNTTARIAGSVAITVANVDNQAAVSATNYKYQAAPTFSSINPNGGPTAGLQLVTITGTGFDIANGMLVSIGAVTCTTPTVVNSTTVKCYTPSRPLGTYDVILINKDGNNQSVTATSAYTYRLPPYISDIYDKVKCDGSGGPPVCTTKVRTESMNGLNTVYIQGSSMMTGITVTIDSIPCTAVDDSLVPTQITCTTPVPSTAGAKNVVITNPDGQVGVLSATYRYQLAPTITSVSPSFGSSTGGGTIHIVGTGFDITNGTTVTINGNTCTVISSTSTNLYCTTPAIGGGSLDTPYDVTVTLADGDNQSVTSIGSFTYKAAPTVISILPIVGPTSGGQAVTITGTGFDTSNGATVSISGTTCTSPVVVNSTTITCTTGASAATPANVVVTNSDANSQSGTLVLGYTYQMQPVITTITPSSGQLAGGTPVTIAGNGFVSNAVTSITIGGVSCGTLNVVSTTSITCTTSATIAGVKSATVTNSNDGQFSTKTNAYTYIAAPTVSTVAPSYGPVSGSGPTFRVYGANFIQIGATVPIIRLDPLGTPVDCVTVTLIDTNTLECATSPAHAAGYVTLRVINPDGDNQFVDFPLGFSFWATPNVASILPVNGPASGSTSVTITGSGFGGATSATIGGVTCTSFTIIDANNVTCVTGAKAAGLYDVVVTSFDGQTGTLSNGFTYDPPMKECKFKMHLSFIFCNYSGPSKSWVSA